MNLRVEVRLAALMLSVAVLTSCALADSDSAGLSQSMRLNPVSYFEIPVTDMDRATAFYQSVFAITLQRTEVDGHDMALFPFSEHAQGVSGALAKGDSYSPSRSGPRIYFSVDSIDETLIRVAAKGGRLAYPKTRVGDFWVAEFLDCEGNQVALSSRRE